MENFFSNGTEKPAKNGRIHEINGFMPLIMLLASISLALSGCGAETPTATQVGFAPLKATPSPTVTPSPEPTAQPGCDRAPVVAPTMPAEIPGYTELDEATGLHITGTAQEIDLESYRLELVGKVDQPLSLSYDDLRCMPRVDFEGELECPNFFIDYAAWGGVTIAHVLELAGVQEDAAQIKLVAADDYDQTIDIGIARAEKNFLAYEWNGEPLPVLHGFPVRAVFPDMAGRYWVKWLIRIEVH